MHLTFHTDYALRLLMYLALRQDQLTTVQEVSESFRISRNHMMKVAHSLGQAGYIETLRGRNGGLRLKSSAGATRIGDVIRLMEDDWKIVECFDPSENTCVITGPCRLKGMLKQALAAYMAVLDRYTLADLMANPASLGRKLGLTVSSHATPAS